MHLVSATTRLFLFGKSLFYLFFFSNSLLLFTYLSTNRGAWTCSKLIADESSILIFTQNSINHHCTAFTLEQKVHSFLFCFDLCRHGGHPSFVTESPRSYILQTSVSRVSVLDRARTTIIVHYFLCIILICCELDGSISFGHQ